MGVVNPFCSHQVLSIGTSFTVDGGLLMGAAQLVSCPISPKRFGHGGYPELWTRSTASPLTQTTSLWMIHEQSSCVTAVNHIGAKSTDRSKAESHN